METIRVNVTHNDRPVTQGWVVRQAFPSATCIDRAHAAFGVWCVPAGTADGSAEVAVEPPMMGKRATVGTIRWVRR